MNAVLVIAEISDKVAHPLDAFVRMLILGFFLSPLLLPVGVAWRRYGILVPIALFAALGALVLTLAPGMVRYLLWDIVDVTLRDAAISELGSGWIWRSRYAAWLGFVIGIGLPLLIGRWLGGVAPRFADHRCAACGYPREGLTGDTCPECGESIAQGSRAHARGSDRRGAPSSPS